MPHHVLGLRVTLNYRMGKFFLLACYEVNKQGCFVMGRTYRGLYILNWIYRYFTEPNYRQWIVWVSGVLQTALYLDFFYYYFLAWRNNQKLSLPQ